MTHETGSSERQQQKKRNQDRILSCWRLYHRGCQAVLYTNGSISTKCTHRGKRIYTHAHPYINIHIQRYHLGHQNGWYLCLSGTMTLSVIAGKHINDRDGGSLELRPECWAHTSVRSLTSFTSSRSEQVTDLIFSTKNRHHKHVQYLTKHVLNHKPALHRDLLLRGKRSRSIPLLMLSWKSLDPTVLCGEGAGKAASIHLLSWILLQCSWLQLYVNQRLKERAVATG